MASYVYVGNRNYGDTTETLLVTGSNGQVYRVSQGQSVDISVATFNELNARYYLSAGSSNPAPLASASSSTSTTPRSQPVFWDGTQFIPAEADARAISGSGGGGSLPAGGSVGQVLTNTGPGAGAWADSDVTTAELNAGLATKANTVHTHAQSDITGLVAALAAKQDASTAATDAEVTAAIDALKLLSVGFVEHNGTSWPTRPTGFGRVIWIGPSSSEPPTGAGGATTNDMFAFYTS